MNKYSTGMKEDKVNHTSTNVPMTTRPLETFKNVVLLETPLGTHTHLPSLLNPKMPLRLPTQPGPSGQRNLKSLKNMLIESSVIFS